MPGSARPSYVRKRKNDKRSVLAVRIREVAAMCDQYARTREAASTSPAVATAVKKLLAIADELDPESSRRTAASVACPVCNAPWSVHRASCARCQTHFGALRPVDQRRMRTAAQRLRIAHPESSKASASVNRRR